MDVCVPGDAWFVFVLFILARVVPAVLGGTGGGVGCGLKWTKKRKREEPPNATAATPSVATASTATVAEAAASAAAAAAAAVVAAATAAAPSGASAIGAASPPPLPLVAAPVTIGTAAVPAAAAGTAAVSTAAAATAAATVAVSAAVAETAAMPAVAAGPGPAPPVQLVVSPGPAVLPHQASTGGGASPLSLPPSGGTGDGGIGGARADTGGRAPGTAGGCRDSTPLVPVGHTIAAASRGAPLPLLIVGSAPELAAGGTRHSPANDALQPTAVAVQRLSAAAVAAPVRTVMQRSPSPVVVSAGAVEQTPGA
ncbi:hypothetical protein MMPV_006980 [Pyropia vietnamensis]